MLKTPKALAVLAVVSGLLAAGLYWRWGSLVVDTFAQCVGGNPPSGVDCAHALPMYGAFGFTALAIALFVVALVRGMRSRHVPGA